jgi:hypothetical protein
MRQEEKAHGVIVTLILVILTLPFRATPGGFGSGEHLCQHREVVLWGSSE